MPTKNSHWLEHYSRLKFCPELKFIKQLESILKIIAAVFFLFIFYSLATALFFMIKDKGQSTRMVKSLTIRIGLSVILFIILMTSYYFGILPNSQ